MLAFRSLFEHELLHLLFAVPAAIYIFWRSRNLILVCSIFLFVLAIDADHLVDFGLWAWSSGSSFWQNPLLANFGESGKVYVPIHAWEIVGFLLVLAWRLRKSAVLAFALALASHLTLDQLSYDTTAESYSIVFRALTDFSSLKFNGL